MSEENNEFEVNVSPLSEKITSGGLSFQVDIYEHEDGGWVLELIDEKNTSIVWDEIFSADSEALIAAKKAILANAVYEPE
jgi:hypothetical protein